MATFPAAHEKGYAVYSRGLLSVYDLLVVGLSNRFIWKCPSAELVELYNENVSLSHLDVGVGTGYFLDQATFPGARPQITLLDPNAECLSRTATRIKQYNPSTVQADALVPWSADLGEFQSIGLNYLLHCLPGSMADKSVVFDHLQPHLGPGGVVFGSTILQGDAPRSGLARKLMAFYNGKGVFSNTQDTLASLEEELGRRFATVTVSMSGCVAKFTAKN